MTACTAKPMGKREAKKRAQFHAALAIENGLEGGWDSLDQYGDDRHLVEAALQEIAKQLFEKSRGQAS